MPYHPRSISQSPSQRDCFTSPLADARGFRTHLEAEQVMGLFWLVAAHAGTFPQLVLCQISASHWPRCAAIPQFLFLSFELPKKKFDNQWCHCAMSLNASQVLQEGHTCHHHRNVILFSWPHKTLAGPVLSDYLLGCLKYGSLARRCFMLFHAVSVCNGLGQFWGCLNARRPDHQIQDIQVQYDPTQIPDGTYTPDTVYLFSYVGPRLKIARNPNT